MSSFDKECPRCHGKGLEQPQQAPPSPYQQPPANWGQPTPQPYYAPQPAPVAQDSVGTLIGYGVISALIPCAGFIISIVNFASSKPQRGGACLGGAVLGMIVGMVLFSSGSSSSPTYPTGSSSIPIVPSFSAPVATMAEYNQIQSGMSYSQVVSIIGAEGREISRNHMDGVQGFMEPIDTVMYEWHNGGGPNMNAMFQNDKLIQKAQFGLP